MLQRGIMMAVLVKLTQESMKGPLRPVLVERFSLPTAKNADGSVVFGPALFGVGGGLSGLHGASIASSH